MRCILCSLKHIVWCEGGVIIHRRGALALLVSTNRAMRRPLHRGTSDRTGSTFFCAYGETKNINSSSGVTTNKYVQRMRKQYIIIPCIVLALAIFFIVPKGRKLDISYTPVSVSAMPEGTVLKVFLENSGSMDGYMCDGSEFKDAVKGFISSCESDFDSVSLNFINTNIIQQGNDVRDFIAHMNPTQFKAAGGNHANTDIGDLVEKVVRNTGKSTISMFISDCILDIPQKATNYFTDRQIDVTNTIKRFQRQRNNAVVVIQLESVFKGNYYGVDETTYLNGVKRPYYIWLFGDAELIANAIKNSPIEEIKHGVKNWTSFSKKQVLPFEITNKFGNKPLKIRPMGNDYEIKVKADLSRMLKSDNLLSNPLSYHVNNGGFVKVQSIKKVKEPQYTHEISITINKNIASCDETLSYIDANRVPAWVEALNDDTGKNIRQNLNKTTGIKYIIQGVAEAYKAETVLGEIKYVINNK